VLLGAWGGEFPSPSCCLRNKYGEFYALHNWRTCYDDSPSLVGLDMVELDSTNKIGDSMDWSTLTDVDLRNMVNCICDVANDMEKESTVRSVITLFRVKAQTPEVLAALRAKLALISEKLISSN
jgi:hypothetical protein